MTQSSMESLRQVEKFLLEEKNQHKRFGPGVHSELYEAAANTLKEVRETVEAIATFRARITEVRKFPSAEGWWYRAPLEVVEAVSGIESLLAKLETLTHRGGIK